MWATKGRLPIVLDPARYVDRGHHDRELEALFLPAFVCVGTLDDIPRDGDFFTTELFGRPLLVRNAGGEPRVFLNVCAHRHATLTSQTKGRCDRIRCQVHGWEYDAEGAVCKVPDARSFTPITRGGERLMRFRTSVRGRLIFAALRDGGPELDEALNPVTLALIDEAFSERFREIARWEIEHAANWKVPVENAIESYHVPLVHPSTFGEFPGEEEEKHELADGYTSHTDWDNAKSRVFRIAMRALRKAPTFTYVHHHAFPSMMIAISDAMSFLQVILPASPSTSVSRVRVFAHKGDNGLVMGRIASAIVGPVLRAFVRQIMAEDAAIYAPIQRGLDSPDKPGPGVLGAREERVHAFQSWVKTTIDERLGP